MSMCYASLVLNVCLLCIAYAVVFDCVLCCVPSLDTRASNPRGCLAVDAIANSSDIHEW